MVTDRDSENVHGKRSNCSPQGNQLTKQPLGVLTAQILPMQMICKEGKRNVGSGLGPGVPAESQTQPLTAGGYSFCLRISCLFL